MIFGNGKPQPKKCPDCNKQLPKARYIKVQAGWARSESVWRIDCLCGSALTWSYPNEWKRSHSLALFAGLEIPGYANRAYQHVIYNAGKETRG